MTLVLSVSTPAYSLQVSDRLVSKGGAPHDPLANKNVVLRATDGLLTFGYTGLAFLDGMPTDTWIANQVTGGSAAEAGGFMSLGAFPIRDVGSSLIALSQPLQDHTEFREYGGEICAVGWQWNGKREQPLFRNVLWRLQPQGDRLRWTQLVPRHLPERRTVFKMTPTGNWAMSDDRWRELLDRVGAAGSDWQSVEALLVDAIREAANQSPGTIGGHCMSILLRPWLFPNALVKFIPESAHHGTAFGQRVEVSYFPWMVAPDAIHVPAVSVGGGLSCEQGLLNYTMQAPEAPEGQHLKAAIQSFERPGQ
ncbi:MAG TPA: hypothetical protein VHQ43_03775 [Solirubrobacterales bacterium]|nr:hypothetical protein [Solirubrobacterales bacterium]